MSKKALFEKKYIAPIQFYTLQLEFQRHNQFQNNYFLPLATDLSKPVKTFLCSSTNNVLQISYHHTTGHHWLEKVINASEIHHHSKLHKKH